MLQLNLQIDLKGISNMNKTFEQVKKEVLNAEISPFEIYNELSNAIQFELKTPKEIADTIISNSVVNYPVDLAKQMEEIEHKIEKIIEMKYK